MLDQNNEIFSWYDLHKIYSKCPAKWRYADKKETNQVPIAEHASILNQEEFSTRFLRAPDINDYPHALTTDATIGQWLKSRGIAGYSGKKYDELIEMVRKTGETPLIWREFMLDFDSKLGSKISINPKDFDRILQMREIIFNHAPVARFFESSYNDTEMTQNILGIKIGINYDAITQDSEIVDYVGCTNADQDSFATQAIRGGYYLKQALLHDIYVAECGGSPEAQYIIAQERDFPHIPAIYKITEEFLEIGRIQYKEAISVLKQCIETDIWPTYSLDGEIKPIQIPRHYSNKYLVRDDPWGY